TSFGHFSAAGTPASFRSIAATARPANNGIQGHQPTATSFGRINTDMVTPDRAGAVHTRSRRPRPAVWCSAMRTTPSSSDVPARGTRWAFVDGDDSTTSTRDQSDPDVTRAWVSTSACRGGRSRSPYIELLTAKRYAHERERHRHPHHRRQALGPRG